MILDKSQNLSEPKFSYPINGGFNRIIKSHTSENLRSKGETAGEHSVGMVTGGVSEGWKQGCRSTGRVS